MAVAFGSASSYTSTSAATTASVPMPAGVTNGDFLLMSAVNSSPAAFTAPAGWTLLDSNPDVFTYGFCSVAYWYRVANSEPSSYTLTMASNANPTVVIARYTGVDTATPIISHALVIGGSGANTAAAPTISGVTAGVLVVNSYTWANNSGTNYSAFTSMPSSPWVTRVNVGTPSGGYNVLCGVTDQVNPSTHPTANGGSGSGGLGGVESVALQAGTAPPAGAPAGSFFPFFM